MKNASVNSGRDPYLKRGAKRVEFWRMPKIQDPTHKDYRPASEDLPLSPLLWKYNVNAYES